MLLFILFAFLLANTEFCGAETKSQNLDSYPMESSRTNSSFSIEPSHSYQYYTNVDEDYQLDSTYKPKIIDKSPESSGYVYSKPVQYSKYEISNSRSPSSPKYQQPSLTEDSGDASQQPPLPPQYSEPQDSITKNNFYYNYYTIDHPAEHTSISPSDAKDPPKYDTKYQALHPHDHYDNPDQAPPKPVYNDHEHYHLDQRQQSGRDADSFLPTGPGGPGALPPFPGGGPSGPPLPPPPPPPPVKGSIDYILIPLILIGIAGPIFVVCYVILGAFEAKLAPLVRSFPDSFDFTKIDLDPLMSLVSRALEKYGY